MRNLVSFFVLQTVVIFSLPAQPVSNYTYKLNNGIEIKSERCWNQVWVQQSYDAVKPGDNTPPMSANIRALGDLIASSSFKLFSGSKEVKIQGVAPGTYYLRFTFKLSGESGNLSFVVNNVLIKPKTKTVVSVVLYDYLVQVENKPASLNGLALIETQINRSKSNTIQDLYWGTPSFFEVGKHDKSIAPAETSGKNKGKIKPGTYDVLLSIGISGQVHKVWLNNFQMKADVNYKVITNLNSGVITYSGGNRGVKSLHLYPAGTSTKQTGNPAPIKNLETISYDNVIAANSCSPGTYDVLLNFGNKYEWRKNVAISTGSRTEVK
jgi:hypothetical protein